ncbi:hypothetical protein [Acinetobacter sp. B51(2017)]|uniref:hypothetical protein n=1 Tax=Acinetobacter sp. B51(2017) TaxID=2060938 RepID=UPI0013DF31EE|nr:hypothetical protein [Acinetobacter sp. B51(2017)]
MKTILIAFMVMALAFSMIACMDRGEERDEEQVSMQNDGQDHDRDDDDERRDGDREERDRDDD